MTRLSDLENVARAIFSPQMIGENGELLLAAFSLRVFKDGTAEDYISVNRMSVESWLDDMRKIPQHRNRRLYGYAELNVGQVHHIYLQVNGHNVTFNVFDCSDMSTVSHAGINFEIEGQTLKGGSNPFLTALVANQPESFVMMAIQEELLNIAKNKFVRF